MLFLIFEAGQNRYALEASRIVEVVPLLALKHMPGAPRGVAGVFNYRGQVTPALDLCALTAGRAACERLSTRIIIIQCRQENGSERLLGLIAERATRMLRKEPDEFVSSSLSLSDDSLGPLLADGEETIQWIREDRLLTEPVRQLLFSEETQAPA